MSFHWAAEIPMYKVISIFRKYKRNQNLIVNQIKIVSQWEVKLFARYTPEYLLPESHFCPNIVFSTNQFL